MPNKLEDRRPGVLAKRLDRTDLTPRRGRFGVQTVTRPDWRWRGFILDSENLGRTPGRGMPQLFDNNDPSLKYQHMGVSLAEEEIEEQRKRRKRSDEELRRRKGGI